MKSPKKRFVKTTNKRLYDLYLTKNVKKLKIGLLVRCKVPKILSFYLKMAKL